MKYSLNKTEFDIVLKQETFSEEKAGFNHHDFINEKLRWYARGYNPVQMPASFLQNVRARTFEYIEECVHSTVFIDLKSLAAYHTQVLTDEEHLKVINRIGKLIKPSLLGIDVNMLAEKIKKQCRVNDELSCRDVCDIRIFRPYLKDKMMDNNPLHRDTWLPILNNCINVYIPVAGNTMLSSLSLIPGSHLWTNGEVERTTTNAKIKGVQYGLPSVTDIKRKFKMVRPALAGNEVLLFSSNIIHGGAVNLNEDTTRVSIEIRFWIKTASDDATP